MIKELCLDGHDSEMFSFLPQDYIEQLRNHPHANDPLWTFGELKNGMLQSVTKWNGVPGCFVFSIPFRCEKDKDGWNNWRGFVTRSDVIVVSALTFIRYEFNQFYSPVSLDGKIWIPSNPDPTLERLSYIRGYGGNSIDDSYWKELCAGYFDWALMTLERIEGNDDSMRIDGVGYES